MAEGFDFAPLLDGVGFGDARVFVNPLDGHGELESFAAAVAVRLAVFGIGFGDVFIVVRKEPGDGGGSGRIGGAGEGNVAFAGEQAGGGIEPDPSRAGNINFGPGVKIGEILVGAAGAVEGFDIGHELDEIAGDKSGGQAKMAEDLNQEPGAVAARTAAKGEGLFGRFECPAPCG